MMEEYLSHHIIELFGEMVPARDDESPLPVDCVPLWRVDSSLICG